MKNRFMIVIAAALSLAACDITAPSQIRTGEIRLSEDMHVEQVDVFRINDNRVSMLAADYKALGRGPMSITIPYTEGNTAERMAADNASVSLVRMLADNKVTQVQVKTVPVTDKALAGRAVVAYPALLARAPDGCGPMPGAQGGDLLADMAQYEISCANKDYMSKMVAYPQDLMGVSGAVGGASRSAGALMEGSLDGTPNEPFFPLPSASEVGQ